MLLLSRCRGYVTLQRFFFFVSFAGTGRFGLLTTVFSSFWADGVLIGVSASGG